MVRESIVSVVTLLLIETIQLYCLHLYRMSSPQSKKQKQLRLTVAEQVEAARLLTSETNASVVMCQLGRSRRTATNINQKCDDMLARVHEIADTFNAKTIRTVTFPEIYEAAIRFISTAWMMKFPVTQFVWKSRALLVRERLSKSKNSSDQD